MTSFLAKEIASQPAEVARFIERHSSAMTGLAQTLPACSYALVAARGSSDHAATYARYVWGALAGLPVAPAAPSLHTLYGTPPRMTGALVAGISQSGQSPDVVKVVEEGRKQGRPTVAFTNDPGSPLGRTAEHVFNLCETPEHAVAATKTYTTQLAGVALLGAASAGGRAAAAAGGAAPAARGHAAGAAGGGGTVPAGRGRAEGCDQLHHPGPGDQPVHGGRAGPEAAGAAVPADARLVGGGFPPRVDRHGRAGDAGAADHAQRGGICGHAEAGAGGDRPGRRC